MNLPPPSISELPASGQPGRVLEREVYLYAIQAAIAFSEFRFAREASLAWLGAYPGDLLAGLLYAQALSGGGKLQQALPILDGLCQADPEFEPAAAELANVQAQLAGSHPALAARSSKRLPGRAHLSGLQGGRWNADESWVEPLWQARRLMGIVPHAVAKDARSSVRTGESVDLPAAEQWLHQALSADPPTPLAAVTHLRLIDAQKEMPLPARLSLAGHYHQRWPDCLACSLLLADWLMESGEAEQAVVLLHQAAARDVSGQVAVRLWGEKHTYLPIWPQRLASPLEISIPAAVLGWLGWNRLAPGELPAAPDEVTRAIRVGARARSLPAAPEETRPMHTPDVSATRPVIVRPSGKPAVENPAPGIASGQTTAAPVQPAPAQPAAAQPGTAQPAGVQPAGLHLDPALPLPAANPPLAASKAAGPSQAPASAEAASPLASPPASKTTLSPETLSPGPAGAPAVEAVEQLSAVELAAMRAELDQIGARLRKPGVSGFDGRFPVYVVFSVKSALAARFGEDGSAKVITAMNGLAAAVAARPGWDAYVYLADDAAGCAELGTEPVRSADPWALKLALADLDAALAHRGQMIGAVLIVGGPEIVPFHLLPNPVDDLDVEVPSDNPYATRDENYFIPEWPLGRLPEGAEPDPDLLLESLGRITERHVQLAKKVAWYTSWLRTLADWLRPENRSRRSSFGYTAAIWRQASMTVFRPIGEPGSLHISPPAGIGLPGNGSGNGAIAGAGNSGASNGSQGSPINGRAEPALAHDPAGIATAAGNPAVSETPGANGAVQTQANNLPRPKGRLAYFNLHGLADSCEWYGQRDPQELGAGPDYPVALRPDDIGASANRNDPRVPQVIFSEACYGAHILGKTPDQAIALKFLASGAQALAGSTVMAYGSISAPLIAADLLGHAFWNLLKDGQPAGEALRRAKIRLASEMHARQGYLDGEDQKTLIGFVLYGDPLAQPFLKGYTPKSIQRAVNPAPQVKTMCARASESEGDLPVPDDVLRYVKHVVSQYLPGMDDAQLTLTEEREQCSGHHCPTSDLHGKSFELPDHTHRLVTLSKTIHRDRQLHYLVARLTLDEHNKLVKLAVSR